MDRKRNQVHKPGDRSVQSRLNEDYYNRLQGVPGETNSEKIRALIDGNHYLCLREITAACVELKDVIHEAECSSDISYLRIEKAGNEICRLLSTK